MRRLILGLLCFLFALQAYSQTIPSGEPEPTEEPVYFEKPKPLWKEKMHYGGNLWLGFFGAFYLNASPMAGYEITDSGTTIAGIGTNIIYQGGGNTYSTFAVGPRFFVRQAVWKSIFVHGEFELMNARADQFYSYLTSPNTQTATNELPRKWEGSPMLGLGFYQGRGGQQGGSFISLMYNFGYNYGKGYVNPQGLISNNVPLILRFGFFF
ncbi:hypothetical protein LAG90_12970 [Marinilongibacter aquaticus]|uniref:hypothetical protein n=1 Tax=Marinilongibacter aquaticus TaxID=2975157 RepID=UPI0021BDE075|nr:hypothetical protein [Marinilongibacter aquaticus]UBM57724.1 hypothetical protein LAG90_12970 [Marinilongibacter aquaticus]